MCIRDRIRSHRRTESDLSKNNNENSAKHQGTTHAATETAVFIFELLSAAEAGSAERTDSLRRSFSAAEDMANLSPVLCVDTVSYTHLRDHETPEHLVCRLLLEKKKKKTTENRHDEKNKKNKKNKKSM
eukprot:TRINITY_DN33240_c0_g1_i1.p1 TRINITY_DN33240_c0_g1~~TRINITY_DN33240_c0_g1_i1.p1  ORF type:complete len:129 (-),score=40.30 TRINITY_DN33240_c0_g1_i1:12-398(-)